MGRRGSVTVLLLLVLCSSILAVAVVVEAARVHIARKQAQRGADAAAFSALAAYDQDLKDGYGLFYRYDDGSLEEEVQAQLQKTLLMSGETTGWRPYDYRMTSLRVQGQYPFTDPQSLRQQILEHMKYRGPMVLVGETAEKLGLFLRVQETARVMEADLTADRLLMRFSQLVQELQAPLGVVNSLEDSQLVYYDGYGAKAAEKAYAIRLAEERLRRLDPVADSEEIAYQEGLLAADRSQVQETVSWLTGALKPVLEANRTALKLCDELIRLRPQAEAAVNRAEDLLAQEDHVVEEVDASLREKYGQYRAYLQGGLLEQQKEVLLKNVRLLEERIRVLEGLTAGEAHGYRPSVFDNAGYRKADAPPPQYPGDGGRADGAGPAVTPELIRKLSGKAKACLESLKRSVIVTDQGPVASCPGSGSGPVSGAEGPVFREGDFESAGEDLGALYGSIGAPTEGGGLIEGIRGGALDVPSAVYESLLINEYVLTTFNCRSDGGRAKHALEETEVEYILIGSASPQTNATLSQLEILAWRTAFNAVSFGYYCPEIARMIDSAAVGLNGLTGIPYPVWKGVLTGLMALIDGYADTKRLVEAESVMLLKYRLADTSLAMEFQELLSDAGTDPAEAPPEAPSSGSPEKAGFKETGKNLTVDYEDHLRAMLLYRALSGGDSRTLERVQDLIYMNLSQSREAYDPGRHINSVSVEAVFTIKSFFSALGGIRADLDGLPLRQQISVEAVRGY